MSLPSVRRHRRLALCLVAGVAAMIGLTYASVPFYRLFCQVTGFGGYTQRAERAPDAAVARMVTVRFNADVNGGLPWLFQPAQREVRVHVGDTALAYFHAQNASGQRIVGRATSVILSLDTAHLLLPRAGRFARPLDRGGI